MMDTSKFWMLKRRNYSIEVVDYAYLFFDLIILRNIGYGQIAMYKAK